MSEKTLKERSEMDKKYMWNTAAMYSDESNWEKDCADAEALSGQFAEFEGKLSDSPAVLADALELSDRIMLIMERAFVYASMKKDEDCRESKYQTMYDKIQALFSKISASMSFFTPELLEMPEEKLLQFLEDEPRLQVYRFSIMDVLKEKKHVLSHKEEKLLAELSEVTGSSREIFMMMNNADMKFGEITNEDGEKQELTHGNYSTFMESHDRNVRIEAFNAQYQPYKDFVNTIASIYSTNVKDDIIRARIRNYPSALEAALSGDNIPKEVYTGLIEAVHESLPALHRYMEIRKRLLGVDRLHMYDVYAPLIKLPKKKYTYEQGVGMITDVLGIMGDDYVERMKKGISQGWIDVYENKGKRSGAYSFGSYDSFPYILLNYTDTLNDVFTLIHEMGHSMHSLYTREFQPFVYGNYSIFTAEVASTVNENFLIKHLLSTEADEEMQKYLINFNLEGFRTTLFRQTMFAEFEMIAHDAAEAGEVLTSEWLCEKYGELNRLYFGDSVEIDDNIRYEWARIPHFYTAFYVYKYATGYSAASAISDLIINGGREDGSNPARDSYIEFLKSGGSDYPIELLKLAGVDMSTKEPVKRAMKVFSDLVDRLDELTR